MTYTYYNLGNLEPETIVEVVISSAANVHLLTAYQYSNYKSGDRFKAFGGYMTRSPISFTIPQYNHWYVVIDLGGYEGSVRSSVNINKPTIHDKEPINWQIQSDNEDYQVKVSSRYLEKNPHFGSAENERTDFLVFDKETGKHIHITADAEGSLTDWHPPRK